MSNAFYITRTSELPACVPEGAPVAWPGGSRGTDHLPTELVNEATYIRQVAYNRSELEVDDTFRRLVTGQGSLCAETKTLELYITDEGVRAPYWPTKDTIPMGDFLAQVSQLGKNSHPKSGPPKVRFS
ncbi:MAG: hypothetical protein ACRBN8_22540 [Nannocystales bacterium]